MFWQSIQYTNCIQFCQDYTRIEAFHSFTTMSIIFLLCAICFPAFTQQFCILWFNNFCIFNLSICFCSFTLNKFQTTSACTSIPSSRTFRRNKNIILSYLFSSSSQLYPFSPSHILNIVFQI